MLRYQVLDIDWVYAILQFCEKDLRWSNFQQRFLFADVGYTYVVKPDTARQIYNHPECRTRFVAQQTLLPSELEIQMITRDTLNQPQLFFVNRHGELMDPSDVREITKSRALETVANAKAVKLLTANALDIKYLLGKMDEHARQYFIETQAALMEQLHGGELLNLTELDIIRISLLRTVEYLGLLEILTNTETAKQDDDLQRYIELSRKVGNEGQRMIEQNRHATKKSESLFEAIKKMSQAPADDYSDFQG